MRLFGFRSGALWKKIVACLYYACCAGWLVIGLLSPPPIAAGLRDVVVHKLSVLAITIWMLAPPLFLSDSPLRRKIRWFRVPSAGNTLLLILIALFLGGYLFAMVESWHSPEYKLLVDQYYQQLLAPYSS